jgi:hypothetical protein
MIRPWPQLAIQAREVAAERRPARAVGQYQVDVALPPIGLVAAERRISVRWMSQAAAHSVSLWRATRLTYLKCAQMHTHVGRAWCVVRAWCRSGL